LPSLLMDAVPNSFRTKQGTSNAHTTMASQDTYSYKQKGSKDGKGQALLSKHFP